MSLSVSNFKSFLFSALFLLVCAPLLAVPQIHRELPADPGDRLVLDLETGATVDIKAWDRDAVDIVITPGGKSAATDIHEIERVARGVRVRSYPRDRDRKSHSSDHRMTIRVPRRFDVKLDSTGGSITIDGLEGTMRGKTMGGHLTLSELKGDVELETWGGNIHLSRSQVDGKLSTHGGKVIFEDVHGGVEGHSLGGEVSYRNVTRPASDMPEKPVVISTHGGKINVEEAPAGAELETMGGNIHVRSASDHVKAKTMGGDITVDAVDGWVEAITMAGDVAVTMIGDPSSGERQIELRSMSGDVSLTVPSNLGMDVEIELAYTKNSARRYQITSDFPLTIDESPAWDYEHGTPRKTISGLGKLGSGEHKVYLSAVNGDIYLKKAE